MNWSILVASLALMLGWYLTVKSVGYLLLVWFDDAKFFVEYGKLFGFRRFLPHFDKFLIAEEKGSSMTYLDFITQVKDGFITRLVTCPKCLSVWLAAVIFTVYILLVGILINFTLLYLFLLLPILSFSAANQSLKEYKELNKKYE
jgi:hypothetical protein